MIFLDYFILLSTAKYQAKTKYQLLDFQILFYL